MGRCSVLASAPLLPLRQLRELLRSRRAVRDGLFVFHRMGKRLGDFRKTWQAACMRPGLERKLFHDLRRSAARDFRKAGVSEGGIMKLCGWKTRAMFDRYNVIDQTDLSRAVQRRFPTPARLRQSQTQTR